MANKTSSSCDDYLGDIGRSPSASRFNDDEPVEPSPLDGWEVVQDGVLVLRTHCEYPAIARDAAQDNFAVLVHAKAPVAPAEASERAPLDLVTVLDVSGSMDGHKLVLLKQAMDFVIDHLGPSDRPVVVAADMDPCVEVARERFRVEASEDIAAARAAAERGAHAEAARILDRRQEASGAAGMAGDARCTALVADRREYEHTGRACLLAGISSHAQQRACTVQLLAP